MKATASVVCRAALMLCAASGCHDSDSSVREQAQLAKLSFYIPAGWHRADSSARGVATSVWTPSDNARKESVTVIASELSPAVAKAGPETVQRLLASAEPGVRASRVVPITTAHGFHGARIELDYVPLGLTRTYHRVHVVVVDGDSLVHVMYTALDPDRDLDALNVVLATLQEA